MSLTKMTEEKMQARAKESSWASDEKETNAQGPQKKEAIWKGDRSLNKCRWGKTTYFSWGNERINQTQVFQADSARHSTKTKK